MLTDKIQLLYDTAAIIFHHKENAVMRAKGQIMGAGLLPGNNIFDELSKTFEYLAAGKPEQALTEMHSILDYVIEHFMVITKEIALSGDMNRINAIGQWVREVKNTYEKWKTEEFNPALKAYLEDKKLFSNVEDTEHLHPEYLSIVDEVIKAGLFKFYRYRGTDELPTGFKYRIADKIGFSVCLPDWLDFISKSEYQDQEVLTTLFGRIDPEQPHYSYFLITLHYKDSIWIATDQLFFVNPRSKNTRRRPDRLKASHYDNIDLPYEIFHELDKFRESQNGILRGQQVFKTTVNYDRSNLNEVKDEWKEEFASMIEFNTLEHHAVDIFTTYKHACIIMDQQHVLFNSFTILHHNGFRNWPSGIEFKHDGRVVCLAKQSGDEIDITIPLVNEVLIMNTSDLDANQKYYLIILIEKLIKTILEAPKDSIKQIMTATEYIEQKQISGAVMDPLEIKPKDKSFHKFEGFHNEAQDRFKEITNSTNAGRTEKAIQLHNYGAVLGSRYFDNSWLATPDALESLSRWIILEEEANDIRRNVIYPIEQSKKDSHKEMSALLEKNMYRICRIILDQVKTGNVDEHRVSSIFSTKKKITPGTKLAYHDIIDFDDKFGYANTSFDIGWNKKKYTGAGWGTHCQCSGCKNPTKILKKSIAKIKILHYSVLMALTGITDRMQLPLYYRNYRHHSLIPYTGNSILDNTHPYALIHDPASEQNPNGIIVYLYMCGRCWQRMKKEYKTALMPEIDYSLFDSEQAILRPSNSPKGPLPLSGGEI